jgi:hypothetical protein
LIFPNAIAWVNWRLRGNLMRHLVVTGVYFAVVVAGICLTMILDRGGFRSSTLSGWVNLLTGVQVFLLFYYGGVSITRAIRRDISGKLLDSHRLMPLSPAGAVLGYLIGPTIIAMEFALVNFIVGGVCVAETTGDVPAWLVTNGAIACTAVLLWTMMACSAFIAQNTSVLMVAVMVIALPLGTGLYPYFAPLQVIACPLTAGVFDSRHSSDLQRMIPVGVMMQVIFAAIFFRAAVRRYQRDDVPALGTLLSFLLLGQWALCCVIGVVYSEKLVIRSFDMTPERGVLVVISLVSAMLIALAAISAAARTTADWLRTAAALGRSPGRKPVNPAFLAVLAGLIICTISLAGLPDWLHHRRSLLNTKTLLFTFQVFIIVASFLLSISYLLRILYRAGRNPLGVVIPWMLLTWLLPLLANVQGYDRHGNPPFLAMISPPAAIVELWRTGHSDLYIWFGIISQFALMVCTAILFYSTQRKLVQRPLEPALV